MTGSAAPEGRLVYLSEDLCGCIYTALAQAYHSQIEKADEFHARWKAATSDPAGDVADVLSEHLGSVRACCCDHLIGRSVAEIQAAASDVMLALGIPASELS